MKPLNSLIIIFAKAPEAGKVKTRLIPHVGEQGALTIYRQLLSKTLGMAADSQLADIELWLTPESEQSSHNAFDKYNLPIYYQQGENLGWRMFKALEHGLNRYQKVVLIGTDCPGLDVAYLNQAFAALDTNDVVLGPANDGGYVLIGGRYVHPQIFEGIGWGGPRVLAHTVERLNQQGVKYGLLREKVDIDTWEDFLLYNRSCTSEGERLFFEM